MAHEALRGIAENSAPQTSKSITQTPASLYNEEKISTNVDGERDAGCMVTTDFPKRTVASRSRSQGPRLRASRVASTHQDLRCYSVHTISSAYPTGITQISVYFLFAFRNQDSWNFLTSFYPYLLSIYSYTIINPKISRQDEIQRVSTSASYTTHKPE
jgi:hypothetical protein